MTDIKKRAAEYADTIAHNLAGGIWSTLAMEGLSNPDLSDQIIDVTKQHSRDVALQIHTELQQQVESLIDIEGHDWQLVASTFAQAHNSVMVLSVESAVQAVLDTHLTDPSRYDIDVNQSLWYGLVQLDGCATTYELEQLCDIALCV